MRRKRETISIIGVGRLGGALALALQQAGYEIERMFVRNSKVATAICSFFPKPPHIFQSNDYSKISSEIILIATQDSEIRSVSLNLANSLQHESIVFHTSGSISSEILKTIKKCKVGSIHPVVSISGAIPGAEKFRNVFFGVEGDDEAVEKAQKVIKNLGAKSFSINSKSKALYHAAAVTACGHLVALVDVANEMLAASGVDETKTNEVLMPLIASTITNLEHQNRSTALTGTFARLDSETLDRHLEAMRETVSEDVLELYLQLGLRSLHLVKVNEFNTEKIEEMRKKISLAKRNLKC